MTTEAEILSQIETCFQKYAFIHKDVFTEQEAAAYVGKKISTLRSLVSRHVIPVCKPGGRKGKADSYFLKKDLNDYMTRNRIPCIIEMESQAATHTYLKKIKV